MKGFLAFVLVLASLAFLLSLLALNMTAKSYDLSKSLAVETTYSIAMDAKAAAKETLKQGAEEGFALYDAGHSLDACIHCPDHGCSPPTIPPPPNICDESLCSGCFRRNEAEAAAEKGAETRFRVLQSHDFGPDYSVTFSDLSVHVATRENPSAKNLISPDFARLEDDLYVVVDSDKFGVRAKTSINKGRVLYLEGADFS